MDWTLDINTLVQIVTLVFMGGMGWMRITTLERDLQELKKEVIDFRELKTELAVINSKLDIVTKHFQKENH
jgi:hypothetical protein